MTALGPSINALWWVIPVGLLAYGVLTYLYLPFTISPPDIKRICLKVANVALALALISAVVLGALEVIL